MTLVLEVAAIAVAAYFFGWEAGVLVLLLSLAADARYDRL